MMTAPECRRQAALYREAAMAEPHTGMRDVLLDVSVSWLEFADRIERLEIVREINSVPMRANGGPPLNT
jgi:hypothetical protein